MTLTVFAVSALCVRMAVWQLDRLGQRRASNARIAYVTSLPRAVLPSTEDLGAQEYRAVRVQGVYDFDGQLALRNQVRAGEYGFHLLTPLLLEDNGHLSAEHAILVDRGWIPAAGNEGPDAWRKYDETGVVVVEGAIRLGRAAAGPDAGGSASAAATEPADKFALITDPASISRQVGLSMPSYYIQAVEGGHQGALPAPEAPDLDLSDGPHLGYAIQWFGFALTLLVGYGFYVRGQEAGTT